MLSYDVVDVFTDRPFAGNQLAVVHGAEALTTGQCLAIAQEFNYSETTFPVPSGSRSYATRIFTPSSEVPFAGHPTLGTAWILRERGLVSEDEVVQHCGAGEIGVRFIADGTVELSATPRDMAGPVEDELVAALLEDVGLSLSDITGSVWVAGTGLVFVHVPVTEDALARAHPSVTPLARHAGRFAAMGGTRDPLVGINLHRVSGEAPDLSIRSRVFVPGLDVAEDPATGAAASGLGIALVAAGRLPQGGSYSITQGVELGRPSRLLGRVDAVDGVITRCHVGGQVQQVASGQIAVPPLS